MDYWKTLHVLLKLAPGLFLFPPSVAVAQPLMEAPQPTIGFENVASAITALRTKSGVEFTTKSGWLIATDLGERTIWSFAPVGYPAYPAVVKRQVFAHGTGASSVTMSVQCEASKDACDALVKEFARMNSISLDSITPQK
jgi:hypothetical protein